MPKKMHSKTNPRKFSDKIALIKQKEALSNASFQSAILGLTEITKNQQPDKDAYNVDTKDNLSSNSYSPESFTSESTAMSFKTTYPPTNEFTDVKMDNMVIDHSNDVFKSCHELSFTNDVHQLPPLYRDEVKFRHGSDRTHLQTQESRYSNIEGYNPHHKNVSRLFEPVSSGSLPDVSLWSTPKEFTPRLSDENKRYRNSVNKDHVNLQETLTTLEQVKLGKNSKLAILEHLKNRGVQTTSNLHPHHIQSTGDPASSSMTSILSSPSLHKAEGHVHEHTDFDCAGNLNGSGHLKHYSVANSPYLLLPYRDRRNNRDVEAGFRQRNMSGNPNTPTKYLHLNINSCDGGNDDYGFNNKALTPTGYQTNTWTDHGKNDSNIALLHPSMFSNVISNENWRRVASESCIQNSAQYQNDRLSQLNSSNITTECPFERVHSLKKESVPYPYQRNMSMISCPTPNTQNVFDYQTATDLQREISQISVTSSFLDNLLSVGSPDENVDPSLNMFKTPDTVPAKVFTFSELKGLPEDKPKDLSPFIKVHQDMKTVGVDSEMDSYVKETEDIQTMNCDNESSTDHPFQDSIEERNSHECYWGQRTDEEVAYTNEPSPNIKVCDNLDPKNVPVDLFTDFSNIPEITLNDVEAQRRDSLNWTDEVLKNLNNENEAGQGRDRAMSGCQPLIPLTEEYIVNTFSEVSEY